MLDTLLLTLVPATLAPAFSISPAPAAPATVGKSDELGDRIQAAGKDQAQLQALAEELQATGEVAGAAKAWEALLKLDRNHAQARKALKHHSYADRWFETYAELSAFQRKEAKTMLETKGLVRLGTDWVPLAERPFRRMGWEAQDGGGFAPPGTKAKLAREAELRSQGFEQQDHLWIDPKDFDKWRAGQWLVGDEWLDAEAANKARSTIGQWWQVPGEGFVALTTVDRENAKWAPWWADQVTADLERLFGLQAQGKPEFVVLNSIVQFNAFAAGDTNRPPAEASGFSSLHYAYFADSWVDVSPTGALYRGTGVAYWDPSDAALAPFGQHAIRHAAALAWLESVDPSWETVSLMVTEAAGTFPDAAFWGEKRIPRWLRYGAASYCERYFEDGQTGEGGDPLWSRKWALSNLQSMDSLDSIETILQLPFSLQDVEGSTRLLHQSGLVVHYILNGGDRKVDQAHQAWIQSLQAGEDGAAALAELESALVKAESKIHAMLQR